MILNLNPLLIIPMWLLTKMFFLSVLLMHFFLVFQDQKYVIILVDIKNDYQIPAYNDSNLNSSEKKTYFFFSIIIFARKFYC